MEGQPSIAKIIGITALIIVFLAVFSFAMGWITLPFAKGSADNVEAQYTYGYTHLNSLKSTAQSVCLAQKAYDAETNADLKSQRQSQLLAYQTNYTRLGAEYDAWAANIFQGKVIRPPDLPAMSPSLKSMMEQACTQ